MRPDGRVFRTRPLHNSKSLCETCGRLGDWYVETRQSHPEGGQHFDHHASWYALQDSAMQGCPLCLRLAQVAEERFCGGTVDHRLRVGKSTSFTFRVDPDGKLHVNNGMTWACFEVYSLQDDADGALTPFVKMHQRHIDDGYLELTSGIGIKWLMRCRATHSKCRNINKDFVPTRLLDLGPVDGSVDPMLMETDQLSSEQKRDLTYIALSHCWGLTHHITTTGATIEARKKSIPWSTLDRTFQDAISVCRRFGVRYIWIDSLCIIQDSGPDWTYEASRMGLVYGNCLLNICADSAEDGEQGFLPDKAPIYLPYHEQTGGTKRPLWLRSVPVKRYDAYSGNLRRRGWVFQEYVLSPRSIRYGTYGLQWECREAFESADQVILKENKVLAEIRALKLLPLRLTHCSMNEILPIWYQCMQEYSRKELTRGSDHLAAISGLATLIQEATGETYLAGIWECDLPAALAWIPQDPDCRAGAGDCLAPSWSWASTRKQTPITQLKLTSQFRLKDITVKIGPLVHLPRNAEGKPFEGFHLEIMAWLAPVHLLFSQDEEKFDIKMGPLNRIVKSRLPSHFLLEPTSRMWCMLMVGNEPKPIVQPIDEDEAGHSCFVMLLEEVGTGTIKYQRFQLLQIGLRNLDWAEAQQRKVTLV